MSHRSSPGAASIVGALVFLSAHAAEVKPVAPDTVLFDFENEQDLQGWTSLRLPGAKQPEPAVRYEASEQNATSGLRSLKITFSRGEWPALVTTNVRPDWNRFETFKADVTADRPCLVGFLVMQEKSSREHTWEGDISRWVKTALLRPGSNEISAPLHHPNDYSISQRYGRVVSLEIFLYQPRMGESIYVDNIRLSPRKEAAPIVKTKFKVLGTDLEVSDVKELDQKLRAQWKPPAPKSLEQVEGEFKSLFTSLKQQHPRAVIATFRDGENGFDPKHAERAFSGWKDAYFSSHGPDGATVERARNYGRVETWEIFMRHRCPLMQVDLSSIPTGSIIHAAKLIVIRANAPYDPGRNPETNPTMWVVEPCNRDWVEDECNAYQFAKEKFWREVGGRYYGEDPDFLPLYVAHGPGTGKVNVLDFTEAVKFWTDGQHANRGFMLHCDEYDWMGRAYYRDAKEIKNRPAVLVIYTPPN